jgi:hypothetical protein
MARRVQRNADSAGQHLGYSIYCPACKCKHDFQIAESSAMFDGNFEAPTFNCELLDVTVANDHPVRVSLWRRLWWKIVGKPTKRCHSHIQEGIITFYLDSTHEMRGQSVLLPPVHIADIPCIAEDSPRSSFYLKEGERPTARERQKKFDSFLNDG